MLTSKPGRSRTFARIIGASALFVLTTASGAFASLIQDTPFLIDLSGTGFGNVTSILTLQNTGSETGSVTFANPSGTGPDVVAGAPHTQLVSAGTLGVTDASQIRIIFNGNETGGGLSVDITTLVLTIYNSDGSVQFSSGAFGATTGDIANVQQGTGSAGFVFKLDAAQAAAAGALTSTDLVGLAATVNLTDDGPDNFFVANAGGTQTVPEPATLLLVGAGLAGIGFYSRRHRK